MIWLFYCHRSEYQWHRLYVRVLVYQPAVSKWQAGLKQALFWQSLSPHLCRSTQPAHQPGVLGSDYKTWQIHKKIPVWANNTEDWLALKFSSPGEEFALLFLQKSLSSLLTLHWHQSKLYIILLPPAESFTFMSGESSCWRQLERDFYGY